MIFNVLTAGNKCWQ